MTRLDAEIIGANWAKNHSKFRNYTELRIEAGMQAQNYFGTSTSYKEEIEIITGFVLGAMSVRKECCLREGF